MANAVREKVGWGKITYFPIVQFIEWVLCSDEGGIELEILPVEEMNSVYGLTNTNKNFLQIREDVYKGAVAGNPRDRFTLCHEVGHFFLHQPESVEFARGEVPKYRDPEWQANTFAAELMAPYSLIKDMTIEEIESTCGMSHTAAEIQYKQLH